MRDVTDSVTVSRAIINSDQTGYAPSQAICEAAFTVTTTIAVIRAHVRAANSRH
jgi:hypothetical protein